MVAKRREVCEGVVEKKMRFWRLLSILGGLLLLTVLLIRPLLSALFLNIGVASVHRVVLGGAPPEESVRARRYLGLSRDLGETTAALCNEGVLALAQADYTAAEQALAEAVARSPEDPLVRWYQGQLYLATDRRVLAIQVLRAARAQGYFLQAGEADYRAGRMAEAREHYDLYLEMIPGDAYVLRRIGETYQVDGKLDLASQYYGASLAADPSQHRAYYLMGSVYRAQGKWEQAIEAYEQAIEYAPTELMYYIVIGQTYDEVGQTDNSAYWYALAHQVAPDSGLPYLYYGVSLLNQRRVEEALAQLELAIAHDKHNCLAYLYYGYALRSAGQLEEALVALSSAAPYEGCSRSAHMGLGAIYQETGRLDRAEVEYRQVLELFPGFAPAQEALDRLMQEHP